MLLNNYKTLSEMLYALREVEDKGITLIKSKTDETFISYGNLYERALNRWSALQSGGITSGSEIIMQIEDLEEFIITFWAGMLGGLITIPLTLRLRSIDQHVLTLEEIIKHLDNPFIITDTDIIPEENKALQNFTRFIHQLDHETPASPDTIHQSNAHDIAFIQYSSGSTGKPKGVVLTHENILSNISAIHQGMGEEPTDSSLSWMPLTHDMGLVGFHLAPLAIHADHYLMPVSLFVRRPLLWMEKASQHGITVLGSPDFGLKLFLSAFKANKDYNWDLSSVRLIFNGAEPINQNLCHTFTRQLEKYHLDPTALFPVYGLAEAGLAVTFPKRGEGLKWVDVNRDSLTIDGKVRMIEETPDTESTTQTIRFVDVGYPVTGCRVNIRDRQGNPVDEGTLGHIVIKGKNVTREYYNNPTETRNAFTPDQWLKTGDIGFLMDGRLIVTGREKDLVVVNGQNYYLYDLERLAEEVEGIKAHKITICGIHNPDTHKEELYAFIAFRRSVEAFVPYARRLSRHISEKTGISLTHVIPVDKLPITTSGKRMRHVLVSKHQKGEFSETIAAIEQITKQIESETPGQNKNIPANAIEEQLLTIVCRELEIKRIGIHDNLNDYGVDSLKIPPLLAQVEKLYPGTVKIIDFFAFPTIGEIAALIVERKQKKPKGPPRNDLQIPLEGGTLNALKDISVTEQANLDTILLSLYIDLISQVGVIPLVAVNVMIEDIPLFPIQIDLSGIEFFSDLVESVNLGIEYRDKKAGFQNSYPLFYRYSGQGPLTKLMYRHDLVLMVTGDNDKKLHLIFNFSTHRFEDETIRQLADSYMQLVEKLIEKYI
ncbi:MAG: AMP-binding protein [bacterium]|nr:AMP-binding protein [bacterium]